MKQLVIDRAKWRTGDESSLKSGKGRTMLKNEEGYMCCLGFYCVQAGIPEEIIYNKTSPLCLVRDLLESYTLELYDKYYTDILDIQQLVYIFDSEDPSEMLNTELCKVAMEINDSPTLTKEIREITLKKRFNEYGIEVIFQGEYES